MRPIESISAIVTTFNAGSLVLDTVESLRRQSRPPAQIIVVDDSSTDDDTVDALGILEAAGDVTVLHQPRNSGVSAARNRGIRESIGDAFVLIDGDDMFERGSLEAFAAALDRTPDAGFAYPTVRTFGNRNDTFIAPRFNLYALHRVNICPIASMVRRSVPEAGIHFADGINPEDWDYWLRAATAGFPGVAATDAVLLWRRWGFTRLADATRGEGLAAPIRRQRPELFEAARLARIKSEWAPALTIVAGSAPSDHIPQACGDYAVVTEDERPELRGTNVMLLRAKLRDLLSDELVVERVLHAHDGAAGAEFVLLVDPAALRVALPVGSPLSVADIDGDWLTEASVTAVSARRAQPTWPSPSPGGDLWSAILEAAERRARVNPRAVAVLAGPPGSGDAPWINGVERAPALANGDWMDELLAGLPALTTWRVGHGADEAPSSALVELRQVTDPAGGVSLFAPDEDLPSGLTPGDSVASVHRESHYGLVPLYRVIHQDGRRGLATEPGEAMAVEALLGYIEGLPTPGSQPLRDEREGILGWAYPPMDDRTSLVVDRPILGTQYPVWRGLDTRTGLRRYGTAAELSSVPGMRIEKVAAWLERDPMPGASWVAIYPLVDDPSMPARGLARASGPAFPGMSIGEEPVGYLMGAPVGHSREIALRRAKANGDILCTDDASEGSDVGFVTVASLGFEPG